MSASRRRRSRSPTRCSASRGTSRLARGGGGSRAGDVRARVPQLALVHARARTCARGCCASSRTSTSTAAGATQRAPQTTPLEANDYYLYDKLAESDGAASDEERVVERLSQDDIVSALSAVPHDFRDVIVLVDIGDFSYQDAAQILDIPIGTVMSRLHRGRRILKRELAESVMEDAS